MKNLSNTALVIIIVCIMTALGDAVGGAMNNRGEFLAIFNSSIIAMAILGLMSLVAYLIALVPGLNKLPVIFWVSIVAAVLCSPLCPYGQEIYNLTAGISLAVISTSVLAFAGLALGKDIEQFKAISWKIIPVSLAVFSGTFIFAALIAQVTLHWSGAI